MFRHPERPDLWVVTTDWVASFPGREAQAVAMADVLTPLRYGLSFDEQEAAGLQRSPPVL